MMLVVVFLPLQQCPVTITLPPSPAAPPPEVTNPLPPANPTPAEITSLPPPVTNTLSPLVNTPCRPPSTPTGPKAKASRPHGVRSLDLDPHSQVECPVCYKLIQPRLMANHAKYFHVTSDLGVECPKCLCEFVASSIFSHLIESHIV